MFVHRMTSSEGWLYSLLLVLSLRNAECAGSGTGVEMTACVTATAKPIQVPIRNITLDDGTIARGIAVSVGTPPQALAFQADRFVPSERLHSSCLINCCFTVQTILTFLTCQPTATMA